MCAAASTSGLSLPSGVGTTIDQRARRRRPWPGSRSSAPSWDRPPCRPGRRARPSRPASSARRAARRRVGDSRQSRRQLAPVVGVDPLGRELERRAPVPGADSTARVDLGIGGTRIVAGVRRELVEALGVFDQRLVAAPAHIVEDRRRRSRRHVVAASRAGRERGRRRPASNSGALRVAASSGIGRPRKRSIQRRDLRVAAS